MTKRLFDFGPWIAGATFGGLIVGATEGSYRGVPWLYSALLYGALWAFGGLGSAFIFALLPKFPKQFAGVDRFGLGLSAAVGASCLVLSRFVLIRDIFKEDPTKNGLATLLAFSIAAIVGVMFLIITKYFNGGFDNKRGFKFSLSTVVLFIIAVIFGSLFPRDLTLKQKNKNNVGTGEIGFSGRGVILVVVDTLRADVLGAYGADLHLGKAPTPNIDALAKGGQVYLDYSAQASWTKPAVASIMTSRHVSGHNTMSKTARLPKSLPTLASQLQSQGIKTGAVVTNYNLDESFGFAHGFDNFNYLAPARYLGAPPTANRLAAYNVYRVLREKIFKNFRKAINFYQSGARVNKVGLSVLDTFSGDKDVFLWLHYMEPHDPYFGKTGHSYAKVSDPHPPKEAASQMRSSYRDEVRLFDTYFGELVTALKQRGLEDKVTIVLTSDHGEEFYEHGGYYHGTTLYEEQLHLPLIIYGPNIPPSKVKTLARQIDIAPTVAALLGVKPAISWEGRDLLNIASVVPLATIAEENHQGNILSSIRHVHDNKKLIQSNKGNPRGLLTTSLFDLDKDAGEHHPINDETTVIKMNEEFAVIREQAQKGGASKEEKPLNDDDMAELRALGYVR